MFKTLLSILLSFLLLQGCFSPAEEHMEVKAPNIVVFLVDDMGWQDTSVPFYDSITAFNERYKTPAMELLASQGMKFTQAYASAVCSPTRISLMTGMNAARHRVTNWTLHKNQPTDAKHEFLQFPTWNMNGMTNELTVENTVRATPLPQILHNAGYYAIHVGKAHFGANQTPGEDPTHLGFDVNIAGHAAGAPASYYGENNYGNIDQTQTTWAVPGLEKYHGSKVFLSEALTREAIYQMDTAINRNQPFFLYMAHYAVHAPIQADSTYLKAYLEMGLDPKEAAYASLIEGMDKSLGDIMSFLAKKKIEDNTIILFMSDNGGLSASARGGIPHTHNAPLNSGKGSSYEGGIREPMIVKWPGVVKGGSVQKQPVIIEDFFTSIAEMAGASLDSISQKLDGVSFIPLLKGSPYSGLNRPLFWHFPNLWGAKGPGIGSYSAVRFGNWKLIYFHEDRHVELYNIAMDIGEKHNLAENEKDKVAELSAILGTYLRKVEAQMPFDTRVNRLVPFPDER